MHFRAEQSETVTERPKLSTIHNEALDKTSNEGHYDDRQKRATTLLCKGALLKLELAFQRFQ